MSESEPGYLHASTITCTGAQEQALINSAACQTSGELRRIIMTLRDYRQDNGLNRSKPATKSTGSTLSADKKPQQK